MSFNRLAAREVASVIRRRRLDYAGFSAVCREARRLTGLKRQRRMRRLPKLLSEEDLRRYYEAVDQGGNLQHQIMLRLLLYTAVRVSELTGVRVGDVDLAAGKIFIERGKGDKDRYILFPESFRLALKAYLAANPDNVCLFESRHRRSYTARRIQQIVERYAREAGLAERVHPHLFRHQMLTFLTAQGLPDSAIQLISGHASKRSLEVYQHLSLSEIRDGYQRAIKDIGV